MKAYLITILALCYLCSSKCCVKTFGHVGEHSKGVEIDREINAWIDRHNNAETNIVLLNAAYSVGLDGYDSHKSAMIHYCHDKDECFY